MYVNIIIPNNLIFFFRNHWTTMEHETLEKAALIKQEQEEEVNIKIESTIDEEFNLIDETHSSEFFNDQSFDELSTSDASSVQKTSQVSVKDEHYEKMKQFEHVDIKLEPPDNVWRNTFCNNDDLDNSSNSQQVRTFIQKHETPTSNVIRIPTIKIESTDKYIDNSDKTNKQKNLIKKEKLNNNFTLSDNVAMVKESPQIGPNKNSVTMVDCPHCSIRNIKLDDFEFHLATNHDVSRTESELNAITTTEVNLLIHECIFCKEYLDLLCNASAASQHLRVKHNICRFCSVKITKDNKIKHETCDSKFKDVYHCQICNEETSSISSMKNHHEKQHPVSKINYTEFPRVGYECVYCYYSSLNVNSLAFHLHLHGTKKCRRCWKLYLPTPKHIASSTLTLCLLCAARYKANKPSEISPKKSVDLNETSKMMKQSQSEQKPSSTIVAQSKSAQNAPAAATELIHGKINKNSMDSAVFHRKPIILSRSRVQKLMDSAQLLRKPITSSQTGAQNLSPLKMCDFSKGPTLPKKQINLHNSERQKMCEITKQSNPPTNQTDNGKISILKGSQPIRPLNLSEPQEICVTKHPITGELIRQLNLFEPQKIRVTKYPITREEKSKKIVFVDKNNPKISLDNFKKLCRPIANSTQNTLKSNNETKFILKKIVPVSSNVNNSKILNTTSVCTSETISKPTDGDIAHAQKSPIVNRFLTSDKTLPPQSKPSTSSVSSTSGFNSNETLNSSNPVAKLGTSVTNDLVSQELKINRKIPKIPFLNEHVLEFDNHHDNKPSNSGIDLKRHKTDDPKVVVTPEPSSSKSPATISIICKNISNDNPISKQLLIPVASEAKSECAEPPKKKIFIINCFSEEKKSTADPTTMS
jgi:hypothetical protein